VRDRVITGTAEPARELQHILQPCAGLAGFDTTANMIALGNARLPAESRSDRLAPRAPRISRPTAVEEAAPLPERGPPRAYRQAKEDTRIGGPSRWQAGDSVIAPLIAANHDPEAFPDPERFCTSRGTRAVSSSRVRLRHTPSCLGQALARVELQAVVSGKLFERFPGPRAHRADGHAAGFAISIIYGVEGAAGHALNGEKESTHGDTRRKGDS